MWRNDTKRKYMFPLKNLARKGLTYIWVNIGSGNGLLPDGTKPSPEPMLTFYSHERNFPENAHDVNF